MFIKYIAAGAGDGRNRENRKKNPKRKPRKSRLHFILYVYREFIIYKFIKQRFRIKCISNCMLNTTNFSLYFCGVFFLSVKIYRDRCWDIIDIPKYLRYLSVIINKYVDNRYLKCTIFMVIDTIVAQQHL